MPDISFVEKPTLSEEEEFYLEKAKEKVDNHPHWFDGKALHVKRADRERIELFEATYAWSLVQKRLPGIASLSVSLLLENEDGEYLWQQRSARVTLPHHWDLSVGGAAVQTDLEGEIRKEALEELGQEELPGLKPEALSIILGSKADLLFSAKWSGQAIKKNEEVSSLFWGVEPPWPSLRGTRLVWRSFMKEKNRER